MNATGIILVFNFNLIIIYMIKSNSLKNKKKHHELILLASLALFPKKKTKKGKSRKPRKSRKSRKPKKRTFKRTRKNGKR